MLNITMLGTGGGMPMLGRFLSSVIMSYNGRKILIDCGEGTQVAMRREGSGFKTVDAVCITHIHGDHIIGLPGLLGTIGNSGRRKKLVITGPQGIGEAVDGLRKIVPYLPYEVEIIENPQNFRIDGEMIEVSSIQLDHSAPCIGYSFYIKRLPKFDVKKAEANKVPKCLWNKLQKGSSIEYDKIMYTPDMVLGMDRKGIKVSMVTDTRPLEDIPSFIKESDVFICEGTYASDDDMAKAVKNKHMTFSEAAWLAKKGRVKKLLLTHFSPSIENPSFYIDNAAGIFKDAIVCSDGYKMEVNFRD